MLGPVILAASRSNQDAPLRVGGPGTKQVVARFIAGESVDQVVPVVQDAVAKGLEVTLDVVGEDVAAREQAFAARDAYPGAHRAPEGAGPRHQGRDVDQAVDVRTGVGGRPRAGPRQCAPVVEAAAIQHTVTLDAEDHTTLDSMFAIHEELRKDFPRDRLRHPGLPVPHRGRRPPPRRERQPRPPGEGGLQGARRGRVPGQGQTDKAYVRVLRVLMEGEGYPMIGSHDPRLISIAQELARKAGRKLDEYEFQMLYGIRSEEHLRLAAEGHRMRVYTAYGTDWYGYFMRRLAEKQANLLFFARSILTKG